MRVLALPIFALILPAAALAAPPKVAAPGASGACQQTRSYLADQHGAYRGQPLAPHKLTELPPATVFMAVLRHIGPCEAPLTMADYRSPRRH